MHPVNDPADTSAAHTLLKLRHPSSAGHRHGPEPSTRPRKRIGERLMLEALEQRTLLSSYTVTSNGDSATTAGTLRYAITQIDESGSSTNLNAISFDLPASELAIDPGSPLPSLTKPVGINGTNAAGAVVISGAVAGNSANGLTLASGSSGSFVQALTIIEFGGPGANGIAVESSNDVVTACDIGTDETGISVTGSGCLIGGSVSGDANVISGNASNGIDIEASSCLVEGNDIGTAAGGRAADPNLTGILVGSPGSNATIGGSVSSQANVISGNTGDGIDIEASLCLVEGNLVGINAPGTAAIANGGDGIFVEPDAFSATIGGTAFGDANVISGNASDGIAIGESDCLVEGNLIGTDAAGSAPVPNIIGILVGSDGGNDTIGGTVSADANVISGNTDDGIDIDAPLCLVAGNLIGTNANGTGPLSNGGSGVSLGSFSAGGQTIGVDGFGNAIAFNGGAGVAIEFGITGGTILFNSIYENNGPGIDLDEFGPSSNVPGGANNAPVITSVVGGVATGTLDAAPNSTYIVDFYANPSSDASPARPQGRTYLGSTTVETNSQGNGGFSFAYTPDGLQPFVTATATDASGTTSDFSAPVVYSVTASGLTIDATAGVPFQGQVASFTTTDPFATAADFTATINWGDGTPSTAGTVGAGPNGFIVGGAHVFTTPGPVVTVTVTITSTLDFVQATANSPADVSGPNGVLTTYGQTADFVAGSLYAATLVSFTDSNPDAIAGQFTAAITWGDGTTGAGTVSASGAGFVVTGTHTYNYANPDQPGVSVVITDEFTGLKYTVDPTVVVAPVSIVIQPKNFAVTPGTAFSGAVATFADANLLTNPNFYTAKINWGDGTITTGTITGADPFTISGSHTYQAAALADQGTAIVTITVTDPNGQTATAVSRAVDPPAAPSVSSTSASVASPASTVVLTMLPENITLSPSRSFHAIVATFADSGPTEAASVYKATIKWAKGRQSAGMVTGSNGRFVVSGRHVFPPFTGTKIVTVTVTNEADGQTASVSERVSAAARKNRADRAVPRRPIAAKLHH
jgi:trimeric autotransporter adhesin